MVYALGLAAIGAIYVGFVVAAVIAVKIAAGLL